MGDKLNLTSEPPIIRFSGIFDFAGLYQHVIDWLEYRAYTFSENKYNFKPSGLGKEIEIGWLADKKVDEYHKNIIKIDIWLWDYQEIEVIQEGKKKKLVKARLQITINGSNELDYQNRFSATQFLTKLRKWYFKHIYLRTYQFKIWDPFNHEVYAIHSEIKEFLNMQTKSRAYS